MYIAITTLQIRRLLLDGVESANVCIVRCSIYSCAEIAITTPGSYEDHWSYWDGKCLEASRLASRWEPDRKRLPQYKTWLFNTRESVSKSKSPSQSSHSSTIYGLVKCCVVLLYDLCNDSYNFLLSNCNLNTMAKHVILSSGDMSYSQRSSLPVEVQHFSQNTLKMEHANIWHQ